MLVALLCIAQSVLVNPEFSQGVVGWTRSTYGAEPRVSIDREETHSGTQSLRVSSVEPSDTALAQDIQVTPNRCYRLSVWVKTRDLDPKGAPVFGTIQAQDPKGGILASGLNAQGNTDWHQASAVFVSAPTGDVHVALFFCGWGKGMGTVWFSHVQLEALAPENIVVKVTRDAVCPGRISHMQYGQFIEYLCDLVPSMWAEKLYDGSFEGLSPYKFEFIRDTDFKEKPWYPYGEVDREKVMQDSANKINGDYGESIDNEGNSWAEAGIAQDGVSVVKGAPCRFSVWVKGSAPGPLHVQLIQPLERRPSLVSEKGIIRDPGPILDPRIAAGSTPITQQWQKVSVVLTPNRTSDHATFDVTFRGPGHIWLDQASLMPLDTAGGWRKDVVQALENLDPSVIRVGGSVLDDANLGAFEWQDTVGDLDKRKPFRAWGGLQELGPGLEEVVDLIRKVGAEPLICLRYEKKTPKDAADEVEYFNGAGTTPMGGLRAKNGHPQPYGIRYWQIGNERWGAEYWKAVPEFARAIHRVDPKAELLTSFPSPELVQRAAPFVKFVAPHQYNVHDLAGTKGELDQVREMIRANAGGKDVKVAVTEWNTTAGDAGPKRAGLWNLANALAVARYHNLLHRNADLVEIANRSNLANSFCSGIIQTSRSSMFLTPTYYAQYLYANFAGTRPLRIESDLSPDTAPDMSATLSEDGKTLTLFAVNDSATPVVRPIDLSAFHILAECTARTLEDSKHAGEPNVANSFERPDRVGIIVKNLPAKDPFTYTFPPLSLTVMQWRVR